MSHAYMVNPCTIGTFRNGINEIKIKYLRDGVKGHREG